MNLLASLRPLARAAAILSLLASGMAGPVHAAPPALAAASETIAPAAPDAVLAAALFQMPPGSTPMLTRQETPVPGWTVAADGRVLGLIGSTWELAGSTGYSGQPLDVLVAVAHPLEHGHAPLQQHEEPGKLALLHQPLARGQVQVGRARGDLGALAFGRAGEERHLHQQLGRDHSSLRWVGGRSTEMEPTGCS